MIDGPEPTPYLEMGPEIALVKDTTERIVDEISQLIIGKSELTEMLMVCLLAEGNVLLVGNPGVAKTTIAKSFAHTLGCKFNRLQFTPDLLPSDITGSYVFSPKTNEFHVRKGGLFANIVMVDEINRANPHTQAALLESMEETSVTLESTTFELERPFMVIATESSIELEGTYPLPTVQLDRFTMRLHTDYPSPGDEFTMLTSRRDVQSEIAQATDAKSVLDMIETVKNVWVDDAVVGYIRDIVVSTRDREELRIPASPRASIALFNTARALAAIRGRDYVIPDDVKHMAQPALGHRLIIAPESKMEGVTPTQIINDILDVVPMSWANE